ncbi:MAG: hypothetical protein ACK56F_04805 [bacterium]
MQVHRALDAWGGRSLVGPPCILPVCVLAWCRLVDSLSRSHAFPLPVPLIVARKFSGASPTLMAFPAPLTCHS